MSFLRVLEKIYPRNWNKYMWVSQEFIKRLQANPNNDIFIYKKRGNIYKKIITFQAPK